MELVDVTVIKITKAMLKLVETQSAPASKDGGDFVVKVAFKGKSVNPVIPDDAKNWLGVSSIKTFAGVPSKTVTNPPTLPSSPSTASPTAARHARLRCPSPPAPPL